MNPLLGTRVEADDAGRNGKRIQAPVRRSDVAYKDDMVDVWGTGTSKFISKGQKQHLHRFHAEALEEKGVVSFDEIEGDEVPESDVKKKRVKASQQRNPNRSAVD